MTAPPSTIVRANQDNNETSFPPEIDSTASQDKNEISFWTLSPFIGLCVLCLLILGSLTGYYIYQSVDGHPIIESYGWLLALFWFTPLIHLVLLRVFYRQSQGDKTLRDFLKIYMIVLITGLLSYSILWGLYVLAEKKVLVGNWLLPAFSIFALMTILTLVVLIVLITYFMMSNEDDSWMLKESDVNAKKLCDILKPTNTHSLTYGNQVRIWINALLGNDHEMRVIHDVRGDAHEKVPLCHLLAALNRISSKFDLYDNHDERLRLELEKNLGGELQHLTDEKNRHREPYSVRRHFNRYLILSVLAPDTLSDHYPPNNIKRKRLIDKIDRWRHVTKYGITKAPFWVVTLFFTVFISIAYLLGFALAFHDQQARSQPTIVPALMIVKSRSAAEDKVNLSETNAVLTPLPKDSNNMEVLYSRLNSIIYFDSNSASPQYYRPEKERNNYYQRTENGDGKKWREQENVSTLKHLAGQIKELTKDGKNVRIEIEGTADDNPIQDTTAYSSNYALSEARAQNIKFLLIKELSDNLHRNIEWVLKPMSNDQELTSPEESESMASWVSEELQKKIEDDRTSLTELSGDGVKQELEDLLRRITLLISQEKIDGREAWVIINSWENVKNQYKGNVALTTPNKLLNEQLDKIVTYYERVEKDARKRRVTVVIIPLKEEPLYESLTLMDYMYFSMYTITTTGYGDIVPTTTYAKFLCTLANIIEFFFIVVFFNALLAVRQERESDLSPVQNLRP